MYLGIKFQGFANLQILIHQSQYFQTFLAAKKWPVIAESKQHNVMVVEIKIQSILILFMDYMV